MRANKFLALLVCSLTFFAVKAEKYPVVNRYGTDITSDMALIYAGADTRPKWTLDEVMPYVIHTYADGKKDWFFDGFLILEFHSGSTGIAFQNGLNGKPANKEEWEWMMRQQLVPLASIDSAITIGKQTIGHPRLRHKAVMTIPAAIKNQTRPFGEIDGREMDFSKDEDRLAAEKWAVKRIKQLFDEAGFKNIDLAGIYWVEESLFTNGSIMPQVNDWIYRNQLRSYWIPYYANNEQFKFNWKNLGFDIAYQQPNYFFDRNIPLSRLEEACDESKKYGLALEMEFESQGKSRVSHSDPDSYYDRLVDYLDVFERKGVFDESSVAWYSGTKGYLDMARSDDPKDAEIMDRMASIVAKRQQAKAEKLTWPVNDIRDLALIYQGGKGRIDWTEKDFEPYVVHQFADGSQDWIFDGYLFLDFRGENGNFTTTGRANGAKKEDWQWYMNRVYEKNKSLSALDNCITKYKKKIGTPDFKHKIVLTILPPDYGLKEWGKLNGRDLDFSSDEDRVEAVKWYIDEMIKRFEQANYQNLELFGFYWLDEDLIFSHDFPKLIAPYIHSKGLEFSWIPYFKARGYERHKDMGFDIAYMQPNHFFDKKIPYKRLDETIDIAKLCGMAVEFECDGDALSQNADSKYSRLEDYINAFEEHGLFENAAIAYYTGSKMFIEMRDNPSAENQAVMDRLCRHIVDRRNKSVTPAPAKVKMKDGKVSYINEGLKEGKIEIDFDYCMANNLYTFSQVKLNGKVLNKTQSDNIGPFGFVGGGWSGGNHLSNNEKTARTESVKVYVDGMPVNIQKTSTFPCEVLTVKVVNTLLMPGDTVPFAIENVTYTVAENSIDVQARHNIICPDSAKIDRYYGMQSMFVDETEILTPGGTYARWTPVKQVDRFDKKSARNFEIFIERSKDGYQAAWLDPQVGLGKRDMVDDDDWVFIGNSYGKSYHKTIGNRTLKKGDMLEWHGVYSWFKEPGADVLSDGSNLISYRGDVYGSPALFSVTPEGRVNVKYLVKQ